MPTASGLPMPMNPMEAFSKGFGMTDNLMQSLLNRAQLAETAKYHKGQLGIQQQAQNRLQQQWDQEQQDRAMIQQLMSGHPMQQMQMPTQEYGQGMGMFTPEGMQQAQQEAQQQQPQGDGLEALRQSPFGRMLAKKNYGFDPAAPMPETPQEKQERAMQLFKQKEEYKSQSKGGNIPTPEVVTMHQKMMSGLDSVLPQLDQLIAGKVPGATTFSPSSNAAYKAKTGGLIDTLMAAQGLPKVKESIHIVADQIRRQPFESIAAYKKRLESLKSDLLEQRKRSQDVLKLRQIGSESLDAMSDAELQAIAGGGE